MPALFDPAAADAAFEKLNKALRSAVRGRFPRYRQYGGLSVSQIKADGEQLAGEDLVAMVEQNRKAHSLMVNLSKNIPEKIIEQMAISGLFSASLRADAEAMKIQLDSFVNRLNSLEPEYERGWTASLTETHEIQLERTLRGVTEKYVAELKFLESQEAQMLDEMRTFLNENFSAPCTLVSKQGIEKKIYGPVSLIDAIVAAGKRGITINRYKGLGEMNPEQLWETTLDPEARSLLQVKINQMEEANETFSTLMGDVVEPRKEFIQDNALNVVNLDI